jgi:AcrR family transcriptional regulator
MATTDEAPSAELTTDGRTPGTRGLATRQRLLEATAELLGTTPWRSVKVIDIARLAGTSPATFYQYFENVERAITVLAEGMVDEAAHVAELVDGDWSAATSFDTALDVAEGFLAYWEHNRAVFRVLELDGDDASLRGIRVRALNAITVAIARAVATCQPPASGPKGGTTSSPAGSDPMAVAGALVAMMASVAAHRYGFEFWGIRTADLIDAEARLVHFAVTGRPGPEGVVGRTPSTTPPPPRTGPVAGERVVAHRRRAR